MTTRANALGFFKLRRYVQSRSPMPMDVANAVLMWATATVALIGGALIAQVFMFATRSRIATRFNLILLVDAAVATILFIVPSIAAGRRAAWQLREHSSLLLRQRLRLQMSTDAATDHSMEGVLTTLIELMERSTTELFGITLSDETLRVLLGVTFPLVVAVTTRLMIDLGSA
uniref:Uncharacterized protein n=1 Tax=Sexangularia sp. CB-2014 TaxID=1486929 RepID=A0A7S1VR35_9EUKA|mmetsp:Transcript_8431/g.26899  ORF Transcript_8431/g.26899 Transcript_8431/m.26899 type:complete len:173 (+) Transcript_8431:2-520(+)